MSPQRTALIKRLRNEGREEGRVERLRIAVEACACSRWLIPRVVALA